MRKGQTNSRGLVSRPSFVLDNELCEKVEGLEPSDLLIRSVSSLTSLKDVEQPAGSPLRPTSTAQSSQSRDQVDVEITKAVGPSNTKRYLTLKHRGTVTDLRDVSDALKLQETIHTSQQHLSEAQTQLFKLRKDEEQWRITENILKGQLQSRRKGIEVLRTTLYQDVMALRSMLMMKDDLKLVEEEERNRRLGAAYVGHEFTYLDAFKLLEEEPNEDGSNLEAGTRRLFQILRIEFEHERSWIKKAHEDKMSSLMLQIRHLEEEKQDLQMQLNIANSSVETAVEAYQASTEKQMKTLVEEAERHVKETEMKCQALVDEREERITTLSLMVKDAEEELRYVRSKLGDVLKEREVNDYKPALDAALEREKELQACNRQKEVDLMKLKSQVQQALRERLEFSNQKTEAEGKLAEASVRLKELEADLTAQRQGEIDRTNSLCEKYEKQISEYRKVLGDGEKRNDERVKKNAARLATQRSANEMLDDVHNSWKLEIDHLEKQLAESERYLTEERQRCQGLHQKLESQIIATESLQREYDCLMASHELLRGRVEQEVKALKVSQGKIRPAAKLLSRVSKNSMDEAIFALEQLQKLVPIDAIGSEDFADTVRKSVFQAGETIESGLMMICAEIDTSTGGRTLPVPSDLRPMESILEFELGPLDPAEDMFFHQQVERIDTVVDQQVLAHRSKIALFYESKKAKSPEGGPGLEEESFEALAEAARSQSDEDERLSESGKSGKRRKSEFSSPLALTAKALGNLGLDEIQQQADALSQRAGSVKARSVRSGKSAKALKRKGTMAGAGASPQLTAPQTQHAQSASGFQTDITWLDGPPTTVGGEGNQRNDSTSPLSPLKSLPLWMQKDASTMTVLNSRDISELEERAEDAEQQQLMEAEPMDAVKTDDSMQRKLSTQLRGTSRKSIAQQQGKRFSIAPQLEISLDAQGQIESSALSPDAFSEESVALALDYAHRGISHLCARAVDGTFAKKANGNRPASAPGYDSNNGRNPNRIGTAGRGSPALASSAEAFIHRWFGVPTNTHIHPFSERWNTSESLAWLYRRGETIGPTAEFLLDVMEMRVFAMIEAIAEQRERLKLELSSAVASQRQGADHSPSALPTTGLLRATITNAPYQSLERVVEKNRQNAESLGKVMTEGEDSRVSKTPVLLQRGTPNLLSTRMALRRSQLRSHMLPVSIVDLGVTEVKALLEAEEQGDLPIENEGESMIEGNGKAGDDTGLSKQPKSPSDEGGLPVYPLLRLQSPLKVKGKDAVPDGDPLTSGETVLIPDWSVAHGTGKPVQKSLNRQTSDQDLDLEGLSPERLQALYRPSSAAAASTIIMGSKPIRHRPATAGGVTGPGARSIPVHSHSPSSQSPVNESTGPTSDSRPSSAGGYFSAAYASTKSPFAGLDSRPTTSPSPVIATQPAEFQPVYVSSHELSSCTVQTDPSAESPTAEVVGPPPPLKGVFSGRHTRMLTTTGPKAKHSLPKKAVTSAVLAVLAKASAPKPNSGLEVTGAMSPTVDEDANPLQRETTPITHAQLDPSGKRVVSTLQATQLQQSGTRRTAAPVAGRPPTLAEIAKGNSTRSRPSSAFR